MKVNLTTTAPHIAVMVIAGLALAIDTTQAAPISVSSYVYGANAESQPQPTNFQGGSISDVGSVKLTDGVLATGSWNDGTNVGFRNDSDNGEPQPRVILDLGGLHSVATIDVWSVVAFLGSDESVSISSSTDGVTFSAPVTASPLVWADGFENTNLRQASVDVSALPPGRFYRLDFLDPAQWMMINEIQLDGEAGGTDTTPPTLSPGAIVDDQGGGPVFQGTLVTYTVTFDDDMDDTTVEPADFDNAGTANISIGTITETGLGIFTVEVTPTSTGTLELRIPVGSSMTDDAGNPLDTSTAIVDDDSITVEPPDTIAPTLSGSDIVDNQGGGPVTRGTPVTYTVTFSEAMDETTVDAADFGNAGTSTITISAINQTAPGIFSVVLTPIDAGTLQLEIVSGATLTDPSGNPLDAASAIMSDTTITVEEPFAGSIAVASYVYGENPESQPQSTTWQDGSLADLVDFQGQFLRKLTDGQLATGGWKDFTHAGFRNDTDNGQPQPRVTVDLGGASSVSTIEVYANSDFGPPESVSISSSVDGVTFSAPLVVDPLTYTGGFPNARLQLATLDVSSLPGGQFYQLDFFDTGQWGMISEVVFYGSVAADPLVLKISQSGGNLDFEWNSLGGMQYDLLSSTDPAAEPDPSMWPPYNDGVKTYEDIKATGTNTTLTGVIPLGSPRFFALTEEPIPPIFAEGFETGDGGFTVATTNGTDWAWGDPDSSGDGGSVTTGNGPSTNCWGTGIGTPGFYANPTDTCLRSAVIDLTGVAAAELSFAQALDLDAGDSVTVNIIDDTTDTPIATNIVTITDGDTSTADWESVGPVVVPGAALGQPVRIEWCLNGTGGTSFDFMGWYIDDVVVTGDE